MNDHRAAIAPLRKVVSVSDNGWIIRETLECGHTITPSWQAAKRRRCPECAAYQRVSVIGCNSFALHTHDGVEHGHDGGGIPHTHDTASSTADWPGRSVSTGSGAEDA